MADDAEMAFLDAQNAEEYDPAGDFSHQADNENDDDEEYDPDNAFDTPADSPSANSASMPESAVNTPPATATGEGALKPQPAEAAAAPPPAKQVRTKGGFVDDSEDDEAEVPVTVSKASATLSGAAGSLQRSVTLSPNPNNTTQQTMPSSSAHDQALPGVSASVAVPEIPVAASVPSGGTPVPDSTKKAPPSHLNAAATSRTATPAVPATPVSASIPKARLPQDKVGQYEDRIADDPRGDIEAWQGLIDEHRKRHKHDEARAVFERFLEVFPQAVSLSLCSDVSANTSRVMYGLNMSTWRRSWRTSSSSSRSLVAR
jgi:cleavage stimulation factor subunit 3